MPKYDYGCNQCGRFEYTHSISDSLQNCPTCGAEVKRVYSPVGISFKGSGFYTTDKKA